MLKILLVLSLSHTAAVLVDDPPYCAVRYRRLCQGKGVHVACQFPTEGPGPSCRNYTQIKFTSDLKNFIVHYINKRRQRIASGNEKVRGGVYIPRPAIMMLVVWDAELAKLGQRLADQCSFVHDDCRATVRYPYAGQSVGEVRWRGAGEGEAVSLGAQRALRRVLDAWWGERRRVYARQLAAPFRLTAKDMVWGHFSQLAVWTLRAVGCGAVRHGLQHTRMLVVCDFSHTNMLGQRTITPGPLAPCPTHTARRQRTAYPLLCAPVKRPTSSEYQEHVKDDYGDDENNGEEEERSTIQARLATRQRNDKTVLNFRSDYSVARDDSDHYSMTRDGRGHYSMTRDGRGHYSMTRDGRGHYSMTRDGRDRYPVTRDGRNRNPVTEDGTNRNPVSRDDKNRYPVTRDDRNRYSMTRDGRNRYSMTRDGRNRYSMTRDGRNRYSMTRDGRDRNPVRRMKLEGRSAHIQLPTARDRKRKQRVMSVTYAQELDMYHDDHDHDHDHDHVTLKKHHRWEAMRLAFEKSYRESLESEEHELFLKAKNKVIALNDDDTKTEDEGNPTTRPHVTNNQRLITRHRWKQTRARPQRPGVYALLSEPTEDLLRESSMIPFVLDDDDTDQLFRDTGFSIKRRKQAQ